MSWGQYESENCKVNVNVNTSTHHYASIYRYNILGRQMYKQKSHGDYWYKQAVTTKVLPDI